MAILTDTGLDRAKATTLKSYEGCLYLKHNGNGNSKWILNSGIYHRERKLNGLVYCPQCLKNDGHIPYFRKRWRLSFSVCCTNCGILLQENCPGCQKPVSFFRLGMGKHNEKLDKPLCICPYCDYDFRSTPQTKCSLMLLRGQKMLNRIMDEGWKNDIIYPHLFFEVFHIVINVLNSPSKRAALLRRYFTRNWPDLSYGPTDNIAIKRNFELLPLKVRTILVLESYWLLSEWPDRFIAVMTYYGFHTTELFRDALDIPYWYHSLVIGNFFQSNINRKFEKLNPVKKRFGRNGRKAIWLLTLHPSRSIIVRNPLACPSCYSDRIFKYGQARGKQYYRCKYCDRKFTNSPSLTFSKLSQFSC